MYVIIIIILVTYNKHILSVCTCWFVT